MFSLWLWQLHSENRMPRSVELLLPLSSRHVCCSLCCSSFDDVCHKYRDYKSTQYYWCWYSNDCNMTGWRWWTILCRQICCHVRKYIWKVHNMFMEVRGIKNAWYLAWYYHGFKNIFTVDDTYCADSSIYIFFFDKLGICGKVVRSSSKICISSLSLF